MKINEQNFGEVLSRLAKAAGGYGTMLNDTYEDRCIHFDKQNKRLSIINPFFCIQLENVQIDLNIDDTNCFYNVITRSWGPCPRNKIKYQEMIDGVKRNLKFIGRTEFYANNLINVMEKEKEFVNTHQARYIFVHGFLPEGAAPVIFKDEGYPVSHLKNGKRILVDNSSDIPKEAVRPGDAYAVKVVGKSGNDILVNVLCRFGKTRSGLLVSADKPYTSKYLPLLSNLEIIHPELTECSNFLDIQQGYTMPPIHLEALYLYNILITMMLCKSSKFSLFFQEKINEPIYIESQPQDEDDVLVTAVLGVLDQTVNANMC